MAVENTQEGMQATALIRTLSADTMLVLSRTARGNTDEQVISCLRGLGAKFKQGDLTRAWQEIAEKFCLTGSDVDIRCAATQVYRIHLEAFKAAQQVRRNIYNNKRLSEQDFRGLNAHPE